jgi:hypothetical protein
MSILKQSVPNPYSRTITQEFTQALTGMRAGKLPGGQSGADA